MEQLRDKVAVVTGAGSGIGRALALAFAAEGARVVLADLDADALGRVEGEVGEAGAETLAVPTDVTRLEAVEALARACLERFGQVDVLCNNAGVSTFNPMTAQSVEDWRWVFDVNLWGVVHGLQTFLPILLGQGTPGHVVNTASIAGVMGGVSLLGPYAATKAAVVSLSETLRMELSDGGAPIGVSVLCPGATNTAIMEADRNRPQGREQRADDVQSYLDGIRQSLLDPKVAQQPEEVAAATLDAIRNDRFWIFTAPALRPFIGQRTESMLADYPEVPSED